MASDARARARRATRLLIAGMCLMMCVNLVLLGVTIHLLNEHTTLLNDYTNAAKTLSQVGKSIHDDLGTICQKLLITCRS
jgi:hypothetical protein